MKNMKDFKGVAVFYLCVAIVNAILIFNYKTNNNETNTVQNEKNVVVNYDNN